MGVLARNSTDPEFCHHHQPVYPDGICRTAIIRGADNVATAGEYCRVASVDPHGQGLDLFFDVVPVGIVDTVGCKSVPDFVEPVDEIPVNRYNRPYELTAQFVACEGSQVAASIDEKLRSVSVAAHNHFLSPPTSKLPQPDSARTTTVSGASGSGRHIPRGSHRGNTWRRCRCGRAGRR